MTDRSKKNKPLTEKEILERQKEFHQSMSEMLALQLVEVQPTPKADRSSHASHHAPTEPVCNNNRKPTLH